MANPTTYTRQYNFRNYQTTFPTDPLPGVQVDAELDAVKTALDSAESAINDIRRSDGSLQNAVVTADSLDESALALLGSETWTPRGIWVTLTSYSVGDVIRNTATGVTTTYVCATAHTSGTFTTDYTAGKWVDLTSARSAGLISYDNATSLLTATSVQAAIDELDGKIDVNTTTGEIRAFAGITTPTGWLLCYGQAVSRSTYSTLFSALSISQSGVHTSGSAIVTGLSDTSSMAAGMPVSGTKIPTSTTILTVDSSTQITMSANASASGAATVVVAPWGVGDGSTTFNIPDLRGRGLFGRDGMGGSAASRITSAVSGITGGTLGQAGGSQALATHTHTVASKNTGTAGTTAAVMLANASSDGTITSAAPSGTTGSSGNVPPTAIVNYMIRY